MSRAVLAAGALAVYPTLVAQLVLAVNHATAAIVRHPAVFDGINTANRDALRRRDPDARRARRDAVGRARRVLDELETAWRGRVERMRHST